MPSLEETRTAFAEIYRHNHWEAGSGIGSMVEHARPYVAMLQAFIRNNAIKSGRRVRRLAVFPHGRLERRSLSRV